MKAIICSSYLSRKGCFSYLTFADPSIIELENEQYLQLFLLHADYKSRIQYPATKVASRVTICIVYVYFYQHAAT
jgi:hypothetical protein